jgi:hypothetical protein
MLTLPLTAALFDDLIDTIKYLTKPSDLPKDNIKWFEFSRERSFPIDPSMADSDLVKQYTIFVYTVGAKSERDVHMRSDLTYYLTVSRFLYSLTVYLRTVPGVF